MKADPKVSEGARLERRAMRSMLRRLLSIHGTNGPEGKVLSTALAFVLTRQQRYDRKGGGLGSR